MKNAILYYYNYSPENIHQTDKTYTFNYQNHKYIFFPYEDKLDKISNAYDLQIKLYNMGIYTNNIIINNQGHLVTLINSISYIMMEIFYDRSPINLYNITEFSTFIFDKKNTSKLDWFDLWSSKNDYLEYEIGKIGKQYPLIRSTFCYYIGLAENAIQLIRNMNVSSLALSHTRIKKDYTLFDLYNPLNLIVDCRVRDIVEYFKSQFFEGKLDKEYNLFFQNNRLTENEKTQFMARMLYPTYYFDLYESIIDGKISEDSLISIIDKANEYELLLKKTYYILNIKVNIEWLKKM